MVSAPLRRRVDRLLLIVLALGVLIGCGQQEGCGLGQSASYPAGGVLVEQGMQARLTPGGVDALEQAVVPLIASQLGAGSGAGFSICVPQANVSSLDICYDNQFCDDQSPGCQIDLNFHSVDIQPVDRGAGDRAASVAANPDRVRALINMDQFDETITAQAIGLECRIRAYTDPGKFISMAADIDLVVDAATERLGFRYAGAQALLDDLKLNVTGKEWWDALPCAGLGLLEGTIKDQIAGQFEPIIKSAVDSFLCTPCGEGGVCPGGSTCDATTNLCMETQGGQCRPQQLGYEGALSLAELLGGFGAAGANPMYLSLYPADYGDAVGGGLSLGIQTGATAEHNPCVAYHEPPSGARVPRSTQLEGPLSPSGQAFDAGIAISERFIEHALWAFYTSGGICLEIGGIEQLSSGTLGLLLRSLDRLTDGRNRPIFIRFNPRMPPTATLGAGTVSYDAASGTYNLEEPLITVEVNNLDIDLYLFAFDRYVRLMTINADVALPIGLAVTPANELVPVLGDLQSAFTRIEVRNAELLDDDPQIIASLLPSLIAGFLPQLAGGLTNPIALPDLAGFSLSVQEITSIENNTLLAIFAGLEYVPPAGLRIATDTRATLTRLDLPARDFADADGSIDWARHGIRPSDVYPVAHLELAGVAPAARSGALEYSYRIDDGLWSLFTPDTRLRLAHPTLLIPGRHRIEVRSRLQGDYRTLDPTPAVIDVVVDWAPPRIDDLALDGTLARISAHDLVSGPAELRYRYRVDGQSWSAESPSPAFELRGFALDTARTVELEVEVQDAQGNRATTTRSLTLPALAAPKAPKAVAAAADPTAAAAPSSDDDADCACSGVRSSGGGTRAPLPAAFALSALGALLIFRRRRNRSRRIRFAMADATTCTLCLVAGLALATLTLAGCDDGAAKQEFIPDPCEDVTCPTGQSCNAGTCVDACGGCPAGESCADPDGDGQFACVDPSTPDTCSEDSDCPACGDRAGVCRDDATCGCGDAEPCGGSCGAGSFCCEPQDSCQSLPGGCDDTACGPGFELQETPASADPATCTVTPAVCECVPLPNLPMGRFGHYTSIAPTPDGSVLVAAYSRQYGDLLLGTADKAGDLSWTFIDGVPTDAPVTHRIDGARGGVSAAGPNVGRYTDLVVADDGTVHIAYQNVDTEALRYARGTPAADGGYDWTFIDVDDEGRAGYWTSITLDPQSGAPGIAYATLEVVDGERTLSRARFARATVAAPSAASDFELATLHEIDRSQPCAAPCGTDSFCRLDTSSCAAPADAASCATPCAGTERCFADGCAPIAVAAPTVQDWPLATGLHTAQARHADGRVVVAFYDSVAGNLYLVRQSDPSTTTFDAPQLIAGADPATLADTGTEGLWPALAIDAAGVEHLAWVDWTHKDLIYGTADGSVREIVDDGARIDSLGATSAFVGDDASLHFDAEGRATIAYQDATGLHLVLATRQDDGSWVQTVVAGEGRGEEYEGAFGFYADHAIVGGRAWIVDLVINQQVSPLTRVLVHIQDL